MTKHLVGFRYQLPSIVDPPRRKCVQIEVPDEPEHWAAFWGALDTLCLGYRWADDSDHTAKAVIAVWRDVLMRARFCSTPESPHGGLEIEDCMRLRVKPDDSCVLQIECLPDQWEDFYDPRSCVIKGVGQETSRPHPEVGQCAEFDVVLQGNGVWRLPVPVENGDTIQITQATGGWYDPDHSGAWNCPDGQIYGLELCSGGQAIVSGDPVSSAYHMALVAMVGAVGYTAFNQTISVSGQSGQVAVDFFANDANLGNNAGSCTFHVKVCNGAPNVVQFTYTNNANGPTSLEIGQADWFNFPVFDGSAWNGGILMDKCSSYTLVEQSGATVTQADYKDCAGTTHTGFSLASVTKVGANSSIGAFALKLRLDSIV